MQVVRTPEKKKRHTLRTVLLSILALLVVGGIITIWWWNTHKKEIIRNKIETAVSEKSKGLYNIAYDSMDIDEIAGNISFYSMHLAYDSAKYLASAEKGEAPPILFTIDIPEINITGVQTTRAMSKNEFVGKKLEIKNPVIDIWYTYKGKDAHRNTPTKEVYEQILGDLKLLQADTVLLTGASIRTRNSKTGKFIVQSSDVNLALVNVKIDSAAYADTSRLFFAKEAVLKIGNAKWVSADQLYNYVTDNISMNSSTGELSVGKFALKPSLGEDAFVNAVPFQDDRFDFTFNNIQVTGVDVKQLMEEELKAESMVVSSSSFKIYRDLARPRDNKNRVGYYPHQVLDDVPFLFTIKKLTVQNSFLEYKERSHITRESGKVQFQQVNAVINNFTNDKKAASKEMTAVINSSLLGKTPFTTNWKFYLFHPKGRFDLTGTVGPIDARLLNPLTEPMGPARIREGNINGTEFVLQGEDHNMTGTVKVLYDNLKVDLLEKDPGAVKTDKKFFTSLLANIVIKNANPKGNDEVRIATVNLERDTNHSMFYLCWKAIFKGIRETIGIKKDTPSTQGSTN